MKKNREITVFYACDDRYVPYLAVSLQSLAETADMANRYRVVILHSGMLSENRDRLSHLAIARVSVEFADISVSLRALADRLCLRDYYSLSIYYRLFIPSLFPKLKKAVYLDADTVVLTDVARLYDTPLEGALLAAAPDKVVAGEAVFRRYAEEGIGVPYTSYFNSGVLVMDLHKMRQYRLLERFTELLRTYAFETICPDQDYLNVLCRGRVKYLDTAWNKMSVDDTPCGKIHLVHYNMFDKPWYYPNVRYQEYFWDCADRTDFGETLRQLRQQCGEAQRRQDRAAGERLRQTALKIAQSEQNFRTVLTAAGGAKKPARPLPPDRMAVLEKMRDYEAHGGEYFFRDVEEDPPTRVLLPQDVDYLHKTARFRVNGVLSRLAERVCGRVVRHRYAVTVEGAEHLRCLTGGAVFTSNHFSVAENLAVKWAGSAAPGRHRMYKLIREGNYNMPGAIGWLLKYCDTLPLSSHLGTMKLLDRAVAQLLKEGHFLLIYPEQSMWWYYKKPRPYRLGAYYYAAKNGVPVVPCFVTLHPKNPRREMLPDNVRYAVHVMPLIYPRANSAPREEARRMRKENARLCREMYERIYGTALRYDTEVNEVETAADA